MKLQQEQPRYDSNAEMLICVVDMKVHDSLFAVTIS